MKRYLQFSIATLCLMIAALIGSHIGHQTATAQAPEPISRAQLDVNNHWWVMTSAGDVYYRQPNSNRSGWGNELSYVGNFWGGTVPTQSETIGGVKGKYK